MQIDPIEVFGPAYVVEKVTSALRSRGVPAVVGRLPPYNYSLRLLLDPPALKGAPEWVWRDLCASLPPNCRTIFLGSR